MAERGVEIIDAGAGGNTSRTLERNDLSRLIPLCYLRECSSGLEFVITWPDGRDYETRPVNLSQAKEMNYLLAKFFRGRL